MWNRLFGRAWGKADERFDKGASRAGREDTRAGWLRKRRLHVSAALRDQASPSSPQSTSSGSSTTSEAVRQEREFQGRKRLKRKYEAFAQGQLMEREINEDLRHGASAYVKMRDRQDRQAENAKALLGRKLQAQGLAALQGKSFFIAEDVPEREMLHQKIVNEGGAMTAGELHDADVLVVPDLDPQKWLHVSAGQLCCTDRG